MPVTQEDLDFYEAQFRRWSEQAWRQVGCYNAGTSELAEPCVVCQTISRYESGEIDRDYYLLEMAIHYARAFLIYGRDPTLGGALTPRNGCRQTETRSLPS